MFECFGERLSLGPRHRVIWLCLLCAQANAPN